MKLCKHFPQCGGCRFQDIPYKEQLVDKEKKLREMSSSLDNTFEIKPINPSKQWFYRNKMEFTFASQEEIICGLHSKKEKRKVVDIEECLIFSEDTPAIMKAIKRFIKAKNYSVYNKYSHKGFLRNLLIRETKFSNELMIGLVTTSEQELDKKNLVKQLTALKLKSGLKSIYWIINDSLSDAVIFEKKELLYGEPTIKEKLGNFIFNIGIDTFFQVNSYMLSNFYNKIKEYADLDSNQRVLDLFCGAGSIGLFLARDAKFVWGVEGNKSLTDQAWENVKINHIDNISFFASEVRKFLNTQGIFYKDIDLLVINPPRGGLSNKIIRAILRLEPKKIIYSSCNPKTLFRDLIGLIDSYILKIIEPFDFFPHTPHVECLTFLQHK